MIGYYAHHHGSGHATRLKAIARHLQGPVTGLSSLPTPADWHGPWVRLGRDDTPNAWSWEDADVTAGGVLHWAPLHHRGLSERMSTITSWIERARPSLVVADVSVEVTLLARLSGIPVVVVAMPGDRTDRPHRMAYDVATSLLAPWPRGTHEVDWPAEWLGKLCAVGGISRFDGLAPGPAPSGSGRRKVLVVWGAGGRDAAACDVGAARAGTPGWEWCERGPASPSPDLWADLMAADVVVTHAGQNAVAEVAAARRPAVVVAQARPFDEQVATATAVDRLGLAVGLARWPDASAWPALLDRAVGLGGSGWERWSSGDGAARAAAHLEAVAALDGRSTVRAS
jgi:hypothetical protein